MKTKNQFTNRILSLVLVCVMILGMLPMSSMSVWAASDTPVYAASSYLEGVSRPAVFANGNDLIIEAGSTSGTTSVYYMNGSTKTAVVENADLSNAYILAGYDSNSTSMSDNVTITMYGGRVNRIYTGHRYSGIVKGNVTVIMMEGANVQLVVPSSVDGNTTISGKLRIFAANGLSGTTMVGRSFDGQIVKTSSGWKVVGDAVVPMGCTMDIAEGTATTVPNGATLTNNGTIVNNGTIHLINSFIQLKGNEPTGTGSYTVNLPYVENASAVTAASLNCTEIASPSYKALGGKLYLDVSQGKVWATIDGAEYYCDFNGEQTKMQPYTSVTDISVVPVAMDANSSSTLTASAYPDNVLPQSFTYQNMDAGTTGASLTGDSVTVPFGGTAGFHVTATDGYRSFTKNFNIKVNQVPVTGIANDSIIPVSTEPSSITLPAQVVPADATYKIITWSVNGPATLNGNTLKLSGAGTVLLTATVKNGLGNNQDYIKTYTITVSTPTALDISYGDIRIIETEGGHTVQYYNESNQQQSQFFVADQLIVIKGTTTTNHIIIESGSPNLVLKDCKIENNSNDAIDISPVSRNTEIALEGSNILKGSTGIYLSEPTQLTIDGNGSLTVTGTEGPGIGSGSSSKPGNIIINGGTITATGGYQSAGIGSGGGWDTSEIIINNGTVTAIGGESAAGIGGGRSGQATVTINGGTVTATGGSSGAGIGGGAYDTGTVTINGGTVTATGGDKGAGIGGGYEGAGTVIIIEGDVTATGGGNEGAGIGGGYKGAGTVTISGGEVTATGNQEGAGIGGGRDGSGSVTIDGGTVEAISGENAAGIGSGSGIGRSAEGSVTINDGNVTATSGKYGAGIGGGYKGAGTVTISGGTVTAISGEYSTGIGDGYGAGIGGGHNGTGTVTISGGKITATGVDGAGIGGGYDAETTTTTVIIEGGEITANSTSGAGIGSGMSGTATVNISGGKITATGEYGACIGSGRNGTATVTISGGEIAAGTGQYGAGIGGGYFGTATVTISGGKIKVTSHIDNPYSAGIGAGFLIEATVTISGGTIETTSVSGTRNVENTVTITGGSIKSANSITATNGTGNGNQSLSLKELTIEPLTSDAVIDSVSGVPDYYGLNDVNTLDKKLYFYLPGDYPESITVESGDTYHHAGNGLYSDHVHSWTYEKDGENTITATCNVTGCPNTDGGYVSISAPKDLIYTGNKIEAVVDNKLTTGAAVEATYTGNTTDGSPVNAGDYNASITLGSETINVEYTIEKATPVVTPPIPREGLSFNNVLCTLYAQEAQTTGGTLMYKVNDGEWGDSSVIRKKWPAGTYNVYWKVVGDENYESVDTDEFITVTVLHQELDKIYPTVTLSSESFVYDGTAKTPAVSIVTKLPYISIDGSNVEGTTVTLEKDKDFTVTYSDNVNPGTATVTIQGIGNFKGTVTRTFTITDKTIPTGTILIKENGWNKFWNTITFSIFCKDYVDVTVTADGTGSGVAKVEYLLSGTVLEENNIPVDGWTTLNADNGSYRFSIQPQSKVAVYVRITDEAGNETVINSDGIVVYEDSKAVDTEVTYTYKENSNKDIAVAFNGNTVKSIVCGEKTLAANSDYSVDYESGKIVLTASYLDTLNAGNYTFTVSYNPMGIEDSGVTDLTTSFILVIDKVDGKVSNINISGKTYDGTAVTAPTYDKLGNGVVTIEYKAKGADDSTYATTAPKNVGDYVVRVIAAEGTNHKVASATAEFSITTASIENAEVTLDQNTVVYNGSEQRPAVTVTWNGMTLTENTDYVVYYHNNVNASDATVLGIVYVVGTNNFKGSIEKEFEITYAQLTEVEVKQQGTLTYNGKEQTPVVSVNAKSVDGCPVTFTYRTLPHDTYGTMPGFTGAGTYTVYFKASAQNHNDYYGSFDVTIAKKAVTVTANDASKTYGDSDPALTYTHTELIGSDALDITVSRASGENANTYTITASQAEGANPNYELTFKTGTFTIRKAALTVTAENKTATYGDAVPNYTVKYEGFKNGDDKDDLGGALAFECDYAQFSDKGEYTVKASGYTSGNYTIRYVDGKLTVNAKPITVTVQNATSVYGDTLAELKATDNGIVNGDANVYSLATTATGTSNAGKYAITGTALDSNYAITFANGEYEITKREITITVDAKNTVVNTTLPTYTYKVEGLVGVDTLATEPTLTCNANIAVVGEYDITASGADAGGNYSIKYVAGKLTVLTDNAVDAAAGYTEELKDYDPATVTSEDKAELEEMLSEINTILADETTTDNGKKALEEVKEQVEKLIKEINDAAEATDTENTEKVENVTPENVTPENKTDLENAKADLERALEDNSGNYTEDEKKAIEDEIKRIDDALEVIGNVEEVEETISKLPAVDTVKPDDEEAIKAITDAQTAYNALSDYEKSLVDEATKANLDKLEAALVAYDIVEGDGSSWTEDSDHNITFVANGLFSKFVGIKVDGKDVDKANYEAKDGRTIITLKASYLDTLAVGEHTISVIYTDGSADGTFNVHAKANSPATGDNSNMFLWVALLFISGGAVITLTVVDGKKRMARKR